MSKSAIQPLLAVLKSIPAASRMWVALGAILVGGMVTAWGHTTSLDSTIHRVSVIETQVTAVAEKADANSLAVVELRTQAQAAREVLTRLDATLTRLDGTIAELGRAVTRLQARDEILSVRP